MAFLVPLVEGVVEAATAAYEWAETSEAVRVGVFGAGAVAPLAAFATADAVVSSKRKAEDPWAESHGGQTWDEYQQSVWDAQKNKKPRTGNFIIILYA